MAVRASCPYCGKTLRESNTDNVDVKDLGDHLCFTIQGQPVRYVYS